MRRGHANARVRKTVERGDLGILPLRLLHLTAVAPTSGQRAGIAAAASLAAFRIRGKLMEASTLCVLVYLGATDLTAAGHHVNGCFLAALELPKYRIDFAIFNQRLQAGRDLHSA